jgi:hypothetical protein
MGDTCESRLQPGVTRQLWPEVDTGLGLCACHREAEGVKREECGASSTKNHVVTLKLNKYKYVLKRHVNIYYTTNTKRINIFQTAARDETQRFKTCFADSPNIFKPDCSSEAVTSAPNLTEVGQQNERSSCCMARDGTGSRDIFFVVPFESLWILISRYDKSWQVKFTTQHSWELEGLFHWLGLIQSLDILKWVSWAGDFWFVFHVFPVIMGHSCLISYC